MDLFEMMKNDQNKDPQKMIPPADPDPRINLAVERTQLALERTQLAWIRTIIGLMTAGVAIDRGFAVLHDARLISGEAWVKNGHFAGLVLSISSTLLITIITAFYLKRMGELNRMRKEERRYLDPAMILSLLILMVGVLIIYFMLIG
jgi:uncharacterized membrane protein YidH (DUF202 family)